jgi:hypothetical protein
MTDQMPDDPDATPPYGIAGAMQSRGLSRNTRSWFFVIGALLALVVLTLVIRLL